MDLLSDARLKSGVLIEALPYIRRFKDATFVIKYGGNALANGLTTEAAQLESFASDVVILASVGIKIVIVHGGGPQIGALLERLGIKSEFVDGLRVTDAQTLEVARMVLMGKINPEIVGAINQFAPIAIGISGADTRLINATKLGDDLGFVGEVESVNPDVLLRLLVQGLIPVVATVAIDEMGQAYNINADTVAGAIAGSLKAEKLIYLTNVEGIYEDYPDPATIIRRLDRIQLQRLIESTKISEGMIPKMNSVFRALDEGVGSAHILDGRFQHSLLLEIFTDSGVGTMITPTLE